jgi:opacity protein-like surface antigen
MRTTGFPAIAIWPERSSIRPAVDCWSVLGLIAAVAMIVAAVVPKPAQVTPDTRAGAVAGGGSSWRDWLVDPARAFGGYGGVTYTYPSTVRIKNGDEEVTVKGFDWIGKPFEAPIYYGARIWRWNSLRGFGTMVDFTHAKSIAKPDDVATFTGTHNGKALPPKAPVKDVFSKLEFSHGHNMLTYNGMVRLGTLFGWLRPYVGGGAGVSLPHTEIGYANENVRTYEYQFAGFAGQGLAGLEIDLGRTSLFLEYKFSYAPYDVPLSHEPNGHLLVTDVWRQFMAWWRGESPPGGRLTVRLATHHGIAGVMIKAGHGAGQKAVQATGK